ncbi:MAG TPA: diguanylate cyclase [Geobacteraceae bacterium]
MAKILVVEDDAFFREIFTHLLTEEGYQVDSAVSGREALEKLASEEYHVVVTDMVMQDISGLDILSTVKQIDPAIEVIMVTGHGNMETAIYALKNGARDYLVKPINHDEFKHTVNLCLEQRRLLDENLELKAQIKLFQVSQGIANCLDLERIHSMVVDALSKEVGVTRGVGYFQAGDNTLTLTETKGFTQHGGEKLAAWLQTVCDWQKEKEQSFILLRDLPAWADAPEECAGIDEVLILFIRSRSALQGVVILCNDPPKPIPDDINYKNLHFLLEQTYLAMDNAVRYTAAKNLLNIDELTGLYNYRYLDIALDREIKRADRFGLSLSVAFLDMDLLKVVNDTYGHLVGSRILQEVGKILRKSVREVDTIVRYGGDEYTIILVETGQLGAAIVSERIRKNIEQHVFAISDTQKINMTACLGYACYPDDTRSKLELLEMADRAMYIGKARGKNTVFHISAEVFNAAADRKE